MWHEVKLQNNAFFATISSSQLPTTAEHVVIKILSFRMVQTTKQCSAVVESLKDLLNIWLAVAKNTRYWKAASSMVTLLCALQQTESQALTRKATTTYKLHEIRHKQVNHTEWLSCLHPCLFPFVFFFVVVVTFFLSFLASTQSQVSDPVLSVLPCHWFQH